MTSTPDAPELQPATQAELARWLAENFNGPARPVYPLGGRTALHYGRPATAAGLALATSQLQQVVDYPARDLTITVEAGIRIDDLAATLRGERQRLPVDVPQSHRATLGGALATNTSGPRRYGQGTFRDYVIGISAVDASGRAFKAGGRVVKNVAGYDLCKLLIGSLGTLAVITQVTLKLKPAPETSAILWVPFDGWPQVDAALAALLTSAARPQMLDVLDPLAAASISQDAALSLPVDRPVLCVGLEGAPHEVTWQIDQLRSELRSATPRETVAVAHPEVDRLWKALVEFQTPSDEPVVFKASLRPSQAVEFISAAANAGVRVQAHAASGIVYGQLPDGIASAAAARDLLAPLRARAEQHSGSLVLFHCDEAWKPDLSVWGTPAPSWSLMGRLKQTLDPKGLLNPHRFIEVL